MPLSCHGRPCAPQGGQLERPHELIPILIATVEHRAPMTDAVCLSLPGTIGSIGTSVQVGQEWEAHRAPLLNALREQKGAKAARVMKAKGMMDEIRSWRAEMQQMALDVREKEERVGILNDELSKLPKNLNRTL